MTNQEIKRHLEDKIDEFYSTSKDDKIQRSELAKDILYWRQRDYEAINRNWEKEIIQPEEEYLGP